jgi:hypothetical protein
VTGPADPDFERLIELTSTLDYGTMLDAISEGMHYDPELEAVVIPVPNTPDEVFPDDQALRRGPMTLVTWRLALAQLADRLPPWGEPT